MRRLAQMMTRFRSSEFARDSFVLVLGTVLAQLVAVATIPALSRLYSPADFGVLAVFIAVASIIANIVTLRYEAAILLPKQYADGVAIVMLSLMATSVLGGIIMLASVVLSPQVQARLGVAVLGNWLPLAVLSGIAMAVFAVASAWLNRQRAYQRMAKLRFGQSVLTAGCAIALGVYGQAHGLLLGQLLSGLCMMLVVLAMLPTAPAQCDGQAIRRVAVENAAAPTYLLPTALLDVVTMQLPVLLIISWYGSQTAGQFSMAWKILALPISLIGAAVGQVFLQRFSQLWPDALAARRLLLRTWAGLAVVGLLPTVTLMLFGQELFAWGLGPPWRESGRMAEIMAPMLLAMLISSPTSGTFLVLGLQKFSLLFGLLVFLYRPACLALGLVTGRLEDGLLALVIAEVVQISLYQLLAFRRIGASL